MAKNDIKRWGKKYGYTQKKRIDFMNDVKARLEYDIGPYFDCISDVYRRTGRGIGFWALPRMLFPIIEAVATTVYRWSKAGPPAVRLLRRLGLKYPELTWEMYRNVLMHGDELLSASYRGRSVRWAVAIDEGHRSDGGRLQIDVKKLYEDLRQYLENEANDPANVSKTVWVKEGFRFAGKKSLQAKRDVLVIGRRV
jgi:hypothetical protein